MDRQETTRNRKDFGVVASSFFPALFLALGVTVGSDTCTVPPGRVNGKYIAVAIITVQDETRAPDGNFFWVPRIRTHMGGRHQQGIGESWVVARSTFARYIYGYVSTKNISGLGTKLAVLCWTHKSNLFRYLDAAMKTISLPCNHVQET